MLISDWSSDVCSSDLTLNPLKHVHPFGTVVLPILLYLSPLPFVFGYAKPVPVAFHRLRNPRRDMIYVPAAGPMANFILAALSAVLFHPAGLLPDPAADWLRSEEHTSELQSLMRLSYAVFCLKKKT